MVDNTLILDSQEEADFKAWLEDANSIGLIEDDCLFHPPSFVLSKPVKRTFHKKLKTKVKIVEKTILQGHNYQADYMFTPTFSFFDKIDMMLSCDGSVWVDVKGIWTQNTSAQKFSVNRKWVYQKFGIYINKVVPEKLFKNTWCPESARLSPKMKQVRKKYAKCKTLKEYNETI